MRDLKNRSVWRFNSPSSVFVRISSSLGLSSTPLIASDAFRSRVQDNLLQLDTIVSDKREVAGGFASSGFGRDSARNISSTGQPSLSWGV